MYNVHIMYSDIQSSTVACGAGGVMRNKGAVGIALTVFGSTILFVTSHLRGRYSRVYVSICALHSTYYTCSVLFKPKAFALPVIYLIYILMMYTI